MGRIALTNNEVSRYVEDLNSLNEGEQAVAKLVACGPRAIEPLRQFLLEGKPSAIFQPRHWAVEALAGLQAKDVLLVYLKQKKDISDPVVQLGEEAVESAAARKLIKWQSEEVYQTLLDIAQERCLPGALEALGEFKRPESIPCLVMALEDDVCRPTAEEALRKIGAPTRLELIHAVLTPRPDKDMETPSSLRRRGSAAGLLAEIGISAGQWLQVRRLLNETDPAILVAVSRMASKVAGAKDKGFAARRLIEALEAADWYFRDEIASVLVDLFGIAGRFVEESIVRRSQLPDEKRAVDPVLLTLLRVKHRAEERRKETSYESE
jgi:HEAT repeat protein